MTTIRKFTSGWAFAALALICVASFSLMFWASRTDSAIVDEQAHIPAGYANVALLDYRLNPEHPPLIKALAELPVLIFIHPNFPTSVSAWTQEVNSEWTVGYDFLYYAGNSANEILFTSRIMPMLITLLTAILAYFLAKRVMGKFWALVPTFMFALDPTVIAQGHYVTTDLGAAFGVLLSLLFFLRWVDDPTRKNFWLAAITFGVGQLTKFSTPLLVPTFIFLGLVVWLRDVVSWRRFWWWMWRVFMIFIVGYVLIVYPVYSLFSIGDPISKQVSDTEYILGSFAGGPPPAGQMCSGMRCLASADIWMSEHYVTRPMAQYMLGVLMALQRVDGGNTIYFLGQVRNDGGWIYFPVLFLLKEPIPTLIILLFGFMLALFWMLRNMRRRSHAARREGVGTLRAWGRQFGDYTRQHFTEFSMASFIVLYWGYSMHSPLNIGIRHLMPTIPLIFILGAGVWRKWIMNINFATLGATARSVAGAIAKYVLLMALLAWILLETLFAAPYFLSYYNEIGGGVWGGYHFVTDSNYDWGQDLLRLSDWVNNNPQINKIAVDYFGGGNPEYYMPNKAVAWSSAQGDPADQGIQWLAVSVNTLELAIQPLAPGMTRDASSTYSWLTALRTENTSGTWLGGSMGDVPAPDYRIGTSIFVYHLQ